MNRIANLARRPQPTPRDAPVPVSSLSMFDPVYLGIDEFGQPVYLDVVFHNILASGEPGGGKSNAINNIVAHGALSGDCQLILIDGKQVELGLWRACADKFIGPSMTDALAVLGWLQKLMNDRYDQLLAAGLRKITPETGEPVYLVVIDEYAYFPSAPDLKTSLAYSMVLQEMLRHTDAIRMSAFTMGPATLDQTADASTLNVTGLVFKLYGAHFGAGVTPVSVTGDTPWPNPKYPVGLDHPQVVAGSPTWPVDVVAALSADRKKLIVGAVNATYEPRELALNLGKLAVAANGTSWRLAGASLDAVNKAGQPPAVTIRSEAAALNGGKLSGPAATTIIYEFDITGGL